ncbi:MAG: gliding motility lipoprotein GldB [Flavobacteriaceae bacterium]|nr:gliding motility lipoprotein GldB [Flavobacteriaceae bacterium]
MNKVILLILMVSLVACDTKSDAEKEIEKIPMDIEIVRFDKAFGTAKVEELPKLKRNYPAFFPKQYNDSIWVAKMQDTLQQQLYAEVIKKYPSEEKLKNELESLFKHIDYYFPSFNTPLVITTTSDVDYRDKIILADSLLIIKLDTYLGSEHYFYQEIPMYIVQNMKESQILPDVASVYAQKYTPKIRSRTFLAQIIYYGRILYLKDLWLPKVNEEDKIGYTKEQLIWAQDNETEIWRNFVENEFLFSTNPKLVSRFISLAPFSKFYLEIDNDSPGMIGRYLGWQIVRSFMKNNTLEELLTLSEEEIFNKSKYKPKK